MRQRFGRLMVLLLGGTIALATVGMGYGLWFGTLTISGTVETGSVVLAFVDDPATTGLAVEPYTNDDKTVNLATHDPGDTGYCPSPLFDDDGDGVEGEDPAGGKNIIDGFVDMNGDSVIDALDAGVYQRKTIIAGKFDMNDSGTITGADDGVIGGVAIIDGLVNVDGVGGITGADDGDPWGGINNDGDVYPPLHPLAGTPRIDEDPPGKLTSCDPRSTAVWSTGLVDEDGDGLFDEDPTGGKTIIAGGVDMNGDGFITAADAGTYQGKPVIAGRFDMNADTVVDGADDGQVGSVTIIDGYVDVDGDNAITAADFGEPWSSIDNDGDGLMDEDGLGGWVVPFVASADGSDIGTTAALYLDDHTLFVTMTNPSVALIDKVYSPTVWAAVKNNGTVPVVVVDTAITLVPAYELYDRNKNGILVNGGDPAACDLALGDECAAPLVATLGGIVVGQTILAGEVVPITLKVAMTPAAKVGAVYAVFLAIIANQYNEAGI